MNEKKKVMILLAIVFVIVAIIVSSIIVDNIKSNGVYKEFENSLKGNTNEIVYLGSKTSGYSTAVEPILNGYADKYKFSYSYINTDNLSTGSLNVILGKANIDDSSFVPAYIVVGKDGKIVDKINASTSEEKAIFEFLQKYGFITTGTEYTSSSNLTYVTASKFVDLVKGTERSVIVIGQTTCSHCIAVRPTLSAIASEEKIAVYYIDYNTLSEDDQNLVLNSLDYLKNNEWGTPLMLVVENNKLINSLPGETTKANYVNFLKENGVLK